MTGTAARSGKKEGSAARSRVVTEGPPERVAETPGESETARVLAQVLAERRVG